MQYFIDSKDGSLQAAQNCGDKKPFFTVMSTSEFHECKEQLPYHKELLHCLGSIRYCKAEPFKNDSDIIIGADTVVALDGKILGKPKNDENAREMLKFLSGKAHSVFTGVTLIKGDITRSFAVETKVKFFDLTDEEIDEYIKTGEPADKAGAYGIQGYGSLLVEKIDGDYFNVVGLPVSKLARELLAIK